MKPNIQDLIAKLDAKYSEYVRKSAADHAGYVQCATCPGGNHWKYMQCGHYVGRGRMATRWVLENLAPQCPRCNMFSPKGDGFQEKLAEYIDARHGSGTAEKLRQMAQHTVKLSAETLMEYLQSAPRL